MKNAIYIAICVFSIICINACEKNNDSDIQNAANLENIWILTSVEQKLNNSTINVPDYLKEMSIEFTDSSIIWIFSSCNEGQGIYKVIPNDSLIIDSLMITYKYCIPDEIMEWEDRFIDGLQSSNRFSISKNNLKIISTAEYNLNLRMK